jgi:CubicO group peptidase (beta-lactamase class C family)
MKLTTLVAGLCLIAGANAQTLPENTSAKIDQSVNAFMHTWNIPGASIAIAKDGKLIYSKGFGFADKGISERAGTGHLFRIASVSKPVTSIAIMKLVQEGKLSLNDKVFGKDALLDQPYYLSVIKDPRIYDVTVKELLEHTSGWDRDFHCDGYTHSDPAFFPLHVTAILQEANPVGDSTLIKFSLLKGLNHKPGSVYAYSNVGYLVLGKIIEKITGRSYEEYVRTEILSPLDIHTMALGKNLPDKKRKNEVCYYGQDKTRSVYGDGKLVPWQYGGFNVEAMNAHGGWIASAEDLTKLMAGIDGKGKDILKPAYVSLMKQGGAVNDSYAKGWSVNDAGNAWHTGSLDGSASFVGQTSDGYTWAVLLNSRADNSAGFWSALDRLPWTCVRLLDENVPATKL